MQTPALLLLTAAAIAAVGPASANLDKVGPYGIRMEYYGKCDDGEYPDQYINMTQVWDEESQQVAFDGYFNRTYDDLADDCEMEVNVYKWGSTGGWIPFYEVTFPKPFDFVRDHFPEIYKYTLVPLGWTKKPVLPGIYPFYQIMNKQITLTGFETLAYGKYKIYAKATIDGKRPTCVQIDAIVFEVVGDEAVVTKSPIPLSGHHFRASSKEAPDPTLVLIRYYDMISHCSVPENTQSASPEIELSTEITALKRRAESFLKEKIEIRDDYLVAAFLCPNIRNLKNLKPEEREEVHSIVCRMSDALKDVSVKEDSLPQTESKKSRFGDWVDDVDDPSKRINSIEDEISRYIATGYCENEDPAELLTWWRVHEKKFPRLFRLARSVLIIPATSASAERNFSRAGLIVNEKRTLLSPQNVNDLLILHNFYLEGNSD